MYVLVLLVQVFDYEKINYNESAEGLLSLVAMIIGFCKRSKSSYKDVIMISHGGVPGVSSQDAACSFKLFINRAVTTIIIKNYALKILAFFPLTCSCFVSTNDISFSITNYKQILSRQFPNGGHVTNRSWVRLVGLKLASNNLKLVLQLHHVLF